MPQIIHQQTKTLAIRPNGRSADFITPNFIYGCAGGCRNSYCYVMRYNPDKIFINDNIDKILSVITQHAAALPPKIPNQTDDTYWTYDIGCSTDVSLHFKHTDWIKIFTFFKNHPQAKATFATKYVNEKLLDFEPNFKVRIRFSVMPQIISQVLEPKTSLIIERIQAVNRFIEAGYDVHFNFSPIVVYETWLEDYAALFQTIDKEIDEKYKPLVKAEGIFLTHNANQHMRNLDNQRVESEALIWRPALQENKVSQYGGAAVRYKRGSKSAFIRQWKALHQQYLPWNTIRYLF